MTPSILPALRSEKASPMVLYGLTSPYLPVVVEVFALELACGTGLDADGGLGEVVDRFDLGVALDQERLVGVEVGVREVELLLSLGGYAHRRDGRVEQLGVEAPQDAVELNVLVPDLEAGPPGDLVHQVDVEPLGPALGGELEGWVGDVGGDRDLPLHSPRWPRGLFHLRASLVGLVGSRVATNEEKKRDGHGRGEDEHRGVGALRSSFHREPIPPCTCSLV